MAQQFATDVRYDTFAGNPPLKAVKLGLIFADTDLFGVKAKQELLGLHDVHLTFFHARTDSDVPIHVFPRPGEDECGWYWHGNSSILFKRHVMKVMKDEGLSRTGVAYRVHWDPERKIHTAVHNDDFLSVSTQQLLYWLDTLPTTHFGITAGPHVGPVKLGGVSPGSFLERHRCTAREEDCKTVLPWQGNSTAWDRSREQEHRSRCEDRRRLAQRERRETVNWWSTHQLLLCSGQSRHPAQRGWRGLEYICAYFAKRWGGCTTAALRQRHTCAPR